MSEVIKWLESPEGERWSFGVHWHPRANALVSVRADESDSEVYLWVA